jgi:hypothetical protein
LGSRTDSRRAYRDRRCGTCRLHDAVEGVRARPAIRCGLGGQTNHALAQCNCSSARVVVADVRCGFQARSDSRRPLRGRARQRCRRNGLPSTRAFVVAASARSRRRGARDISGSRFPRAVQSGWPHWTGWCRTSPVVTQQSPIHTLICTRVRGARAWRELSGHRLGSSGRTPPRHVKPDSRLSFGTIRRSFRDRPVPGHWSSAGHRNRRSRWANTTSSMRRRRSSSSAASECRVLSLRGEIQTSATEVLSGRRPPRSGLPACARSLTRCLLVV